MFVVLKVTHDLWEMIAYELREPLNADALIYLTVGRGILNGLHVYTDLFESKPPGIFLLSAASLFLTGGTMLMRVLEMATLIQMPLMLVWYSVRRCRDGCSQTLAFTLTATAYIFGGLLALRAQELAGGLQTEMFGMLFATLYILQLGLHPHSTTWRSTLTRGLLLMFAIGMREPFVISVLAGVLILSSTARELKAYFVQPLIIAVLTGAFILFVFGMLGPYVQVYLPAMLFLRTQHPSLEPLLVRTLWVHRLFSSLTSYSTMPVLGYDFAGLWLFAITVKIQLGRLPLFLTIVAAVGGLLCFHYLFVLIVLFYKVAPLSMTPWMVLTNATFQPISLTYLIGFGLYLSLLSFLAFKHFRILLHVGSGLFVLLLLSVTIGIGGYQWNYMLFAYPAILASILLFLRHASERRYQPLLIGVTLMLCVTATSYRALPENKNSQSVDLSAASQQASKQLDRLLDACKIDRYIFAGGFPIFAFAHHSPMGPIFTPYFHDYLGFEHPLYQQTFNYIAEQGEFFLQPTVPPYGKNVLPEVIVEEFNASVPECARDLESLPGYHVLFKNASHQSTSIPH